MTWFRVDDGFSDHPKVDALGDGPCLEAAIALWTLAGAWAAKHLTDGFVPAGRLARIGVKNAAKAAEELVRVGLWEREEEGYRFRNWCDYQPTRARVEAEREKTADRVRRHRDRPATVTPSVGNAVTPTVSNAAPVPTRPDPSRPKEIENARAVEAVLTRNDPKPQPRGVVHQIAERLCAVHKELTGRAWTHPQELLEALDGRGALVRTGMPDQVRAIAAHVAGETDPVAAAERALRGWAADPWVKANRYPMAHLAKDPLKYLAKVAPSSSAPSDFSHVNDSDPLPFG